MADMTRSWTLEELEPLIRSTVSELKCPPNRLKSFHPEDRQDIRNEENGYAIMADTLLRKLREDALSKQST